MLLELLLDNVLALDAEVAHADEEHGVGDGGDVAAEHEKVQNDLGMTVSAYLL